MGCKPFICCRTNKIIYCYIHKKYEATSINPFLCIFFVCKLNAKMCSLLACIILYKKGLWSHFDASNLKEYRIQSRDSAIQPSWKIFIMMQVKYISLLRTTHSLTIWCFISNHHKIPKKSHRTSHVTIISRRDC